MVQLNFSRLIEYESIGLHAVMEMLRVNLPLKLGMNDSSQRMLGSSQQELLYKNTVGQ